MIRVPKGKNGSESAVVEHDTRACHDLQGCCFVCTLNECKGTECCTSQGPPCLLGPLPFQLELVLSPAQPLSAGGRLRDAGLRVKKKKVAPSLCVRERTEMVQWVKSPLGLEGGKGARGYKGKLLVHLMYCNHLRLEHSDLMC